MDEDKKNTKKNYSKKKNENCLENDNKNSSGKSKKNLNKQNPFNHKLNKLSIRGRTNESNISSNNLNNHNLDEIEKEENSNNDSNHQSNHFHQSKFNNSKQKKAFHEIQKQQNSENKNKVESVKNKKNYFCRLRKHHLVKKYQNFNNRISNNQYSYHQNSNHQSLNYQNSNHQSSYHQNSNHQALSNQISNHQSLNQDRQNHLQPCTSEQALTSQGSYKKNLSPSSKFRLKILKYRNRRKRTEVNNHSSSSSNSTPNLNLTNNENPRRNEDHISSHTDNTSMYYRHLREQRIAAQLSRPSNICINADPVSSSNDESNRPSFSDLLASSSVVSAMRRCSFVPSVQLTRMFEDFRSMQIASSSNFDTNGADQLTIKKNTNTYSYKKNNQKLKDVRKEQYESCVICLVEYENEDKIRRLPCMHIFHTRCIDQWLVKNKKCPVCRVEIDHNSDFINSLI